MGTGASSVQSAEHPSSQLSFTLPKSASPAKCYKKGDPLPAPLGSGLFRLYSMRFCPYSERVRLVLEFKRIPYELVYVALRRFAPEWLKERHPRGAVPVLEKEGCVLRDSLVICQYLDETRPQRYRLQPQDAYQRACQALLIADWDKVTKAFHEVTDHLDDATTWDKFLNELDHFEKELEQTGFPYFGGLAPAMMDMVAWPVIERCPALHRINPAFQLGPPGRFPRLSAWQQRMLQQPAVQACLIDAESHAVVLKSFGTDEPAYALGLQ